MEYNGWMDNDLLIIVVVYLVVRLELPIANYHACRNNSEAQNLCTNKTQTVKIQINKQ